MNSRRSSTRMERVDEIKIPENKYIIIPDTKANTHIAIETVPLYSFFFKIPEKNIGNSIRKKIRNVDIVVGDRDCNRTINNISKAIVKEDLRDVTTQIEQTRELQQQINSPYPVCLAVSANRSEIGEQYYYTFYQGELENRSIYPKWYVMILPLMIVCIFLVIMYEYSERTFTLKLKESSKKWNNSKCTMSILLLTISVIIMTCIYNEYNSLLKSIRWFKKRLDNRAHVPYMIEKKTNNWYIIGIFFIVDLLIWRCGINKYAYIVPSIIQFILLVDMYYVKTTGLTTYNVIATITVIAIAIFLFTISTEKKSSKQTVMIIINTIGIVLIMCMYWLNKITKSKNEV